MPTDRSQAIEQILSVYAEAKLYFAIAEMEQAERMQVLISNAYTEGRLAWTRHKVAAIQEIHRDAPAWRNVIKKYRRVLKKLNKRPEADIIAEQLKPLDDTDSSAVRFADGGGIFRNLPNM